MTDSEKVSMPDNISRKILVVDDDQTIRSLCEEILDVAGYEVDTARHGLDALEMLQNTKYDLVISDVNMPELSGVELYTSSLERHPYLRDRFLFMTGYITEELESLAERMGLKCLSKPFRISELLSSVDCVMARSLKEAWRGYEKGKRLESRFDLEIECRIAPGTEKAPPLSAKVLNLSLNGMKAVYQGTLIAPGTRVSLCMSINGLNLCRGARAVWSMGGARLHASGFKLDEPMPVSSIVNMTRQRQSAEPLMNSRFKDAPRTS